MSAKPKKKFWISIDSREQQPYNFRGVVNPVLDFETRREAIPTGDYAVRRGSVAEIPWKEMQPEHYRQCATIERKTIEDFYKSLANSRDRFEAEIIRMEAWGYAAIVVEAPLGTILSPNPALMKHAVFNAKSALASIIAWEQRYSIHFWTPDNRELGERLTHRLLERWIRDEE